ncbi:MAG TPA: hypothetical protein VL595_21990 [Pseudonocardia sp.]|jgi:hypothetical protein|nr:hypothetical protein [Pseudonocardia sp.]
MNTTITTLSYRDRAILKAIANGRCTVSGSHASTLTIDGLRCADQFVGPRLADAGLIVTDGQRPNRAELTETGRALLLAA